MIACSLSLSLFLFLCCFLQRREARDQGREEALPAREGDMRRALLDDRTLSLPLALAIMQRLQQLSVGACVCV